MKDLLNRYIYLTQQLSMNGINVEDFDYNEIEEILEDKYHLTYLSINMLQQMATFSVDFNKKVLFTNETILKAWYVFYPMYKEELFNE